MTEDEALAEWDRVAVAASDDAEVQHFGADMVLVMALRSLGWGRLADRWQKASDDWRWA